MDVTTALGGILGKGHAQDDGNTMEVTRALGGILSKRHAQDDGNTMEVTRALGGILGKRHDQDDGNTMEVTRALGGILSKRHDQDDGNTMEVTRALGGILGKRHDQDDGNTMEVTRALGGILGKRHDQDDGNTMEVTRALGGILGKRHDQDDGNTMEVTRALGGILGKRHDQDDGNTMEVTRALGGILGKRHDQDDGNTMEVTRALGGILGKRHDQDDGNTMEVTRALGGILGKRHDQDDGNTMEVTRALGGILGKRHDQDDGNTMEVTRALGGILGKRHDQDDENTMEVTRALRGILGKRHDQDDGNTMEVTRALGGILSKSPSGPVSRNKFGDHQHQVLNTSVICGDEKGALAEMKGLDNIELARPLDKIKLFREKMEENMTINQATSMKYFPPLPLPKIENTKTLTNESSKKVEKASNILANKHTMENGVPMGVIGTTTLDPSEATEKDTTTTHGGITSNHQRIVDPKTLHKNFYQNTNREMYISPINLLSSPSLRPSSTIRRSATGLGSPSLLGLQRKELRQSNDGKSFTTLAPHKTVDERRETIITENPTTQLGGILQIEDSTACESSNTCKSTLERCSNLELKVTTPVLVMGENLTLSTQNFLSDEQQLSAIPIPLLTPQRRKITGIGLDKVGLGSPLVADLLDRRGSIGDLASKFVQGGNDHIILSPENKYSSSVERGPRESSKQKIKDQRSRVAIQEKTLTNNLKEMIQSLTPNRRLIRGRKSLHVGGAKGILGKRPIELDEDDNDDEMEDFKRYKTTSPFKSVSIQSHPETKMDSGKITVSSQVLSNNATSTSREASISVAESSRPSEKISELSGNIIYQTSDGNQKFEELRDNLSSNEEKLKYNQIQLQDFLEMTRIRFMELTTTKRRHTTAPKSTSIKQDIEKQDSLEDCIVAGATQIPMLELFQHACHELKRYISDGRKTVREIEKETWEENPPLFQEYLSATPDLKLLMDNQLKNVRTHARLLAKGQWYDWRMTLLNTLEGGLAKTIQDMTIDENTLDRQQLLLAPIVPNLTQTVRNLEQEESQINAASRELANCDQDKLSEARHRLVTIDTENKAKILLISELQNELRAKEKEIELSIARKKAWKEEINEHEKIKEELRGWTCTEVNAIKNRVCKMEEEYGWTITRVSGTLISMIFRRELELTFDASSFRCRTTHATKEPLNSRIGLKYIGPNQEINCLSLAAVKDFFLQFIGSEVSRLQHRQTNIKDLLENVSNSWNKANEVINEVYLLTLSCPTKVAKISNNSIVVHSTLILKPLATKIAIKLHLTAQSADKGIEMEIMPDANVIYGERFNEPKMKEFLLKRCRYGLEERDPCNTSSWGIVVSELGDRLLARSRR
ncbi:unnamed protein product [Blumeria hordei]|uniref:Spc7 kinetochore protein domain-containing protein n=1 Tax=Blumeria hordei TaxID=2867405 RepID=A0A383UHT9_BLUHO|nr:unnamed protein product [Blumeria hordei]